MFNKNKIKNLEDEVAKLQEQLEKCDHRSRVNESNYNYSMKVLTKLLDFYVRDNGKLDMDGTLVLKKSYD